MTLKCSLDKYNTMHLFSSRRLFRYILVFVSMDGVWCEWYTSGVISRVVPGLFSSGCNSSCHISSMPSSNKSATGLRRDTSLMPPASMNSSSSSHFSSRWGLVQNRNFRRVEDPSSIAVLKSVFRLIINQSHKETSSLNSV